MNNTEGLEQYSELISQLKTRASCKSLKTNCFLSTGEIGNYIAQGNWKYLEEPQKLYFFQKDAVAVHVYYYVANEEVPEFEFVSEVPIMVDFVLRERELAGFESMTFPLWQKAGFAFYKKYQRMRCNLRDYEVNGREGLPDGYEIKTAGAEQAEEIRKLWEMFLDKYDIALPSVSEMTEQIHMGNVVCCMDHGKVCGAIFVDVNGRSGLVQHVTVHEEYRRKALGQHMMQYLCENLPKRNVTDFKLWVDVNNVAAINLYLKSGFKKDGIFSVKLMKG